VIVTLGGGSDKDSGKTEGGVGRDYLLANGVPFDRIIAETQSFDTQQQVQRLAEIAGASTSTTSSWSAMARTCFASRCCATARG
jgi:uncharacterized SAM-binding protein YcdF (DUF218 family)